MNPWTIIGWCLVILVMWITIWVTGYILARHIEPFVRTRYRHLKTRRIPPGAGQVWMQGGSPLEIKRVTEGGRVVMESGNASWSDSPEGWRERVKERRLWLDQGTTRGKN